MKNIKVAVLDPTGIVVNEMEMDWPADQLDRFLSGCRITILSNEEPVHLVSKKHRWPWNKENGKIVKK